MLVVIHRVLKVRVDRDGIICARSDLRNIGGILSVVDVHNDFISGDIVGIPVAVVTVFQSESIAIGYVTESGNFVPAVVGYIISIGYRFVGSA